MARFAYASPVGEDECVGLLSANPGAMLYAGGTDMMVKIHEKILSPDMLVDIKGIDSLKGIRQNPDGSVIIGPLATHTEIAESPLIQERFSLLSTACRQVGSRQIRNRGTIGGNLCNGSPSAETLPCLYVMSARLHLKSARGERILPVDEFCTGPQKTCLCRGELLTAIEIPAIKGEYDGVYYRVSRRNAVDITSVNCAIMWRQNPGTSTGKRFSTAFGAVAPTVVRAVKTEEFLNRASSCGDDVIEEAGRLTVKDISPIDDLRSTCSHRIEMAGVLLKKGLRYLLCGRGGK